MLFVFKEVLEQAPRQAVLLMKSAIHQLLEFCIPVFVASSNYLLSKSKNNTATNNQASGSPTQSITWLYLK